MRFGVLGPLLVDAGSGEIAIARRERVLLAVLLVHANRTVSVARVVDAIWGDRPPADSTGQVHATVYRLRKALAAAGGSGGVIVTDPAGYQIRVDPPSFDLAQFRELRDRARAAAGGGDQDAARGLFRAALELWRGPALDGVDSDLVRHSAAGLDEEHLQAAEECIEVELSLGRGREVVAELTELVGRHPHRDGLHRALMLALYRAGRQADALAAYRHARGLLQEELGLEPGPELQRLHQAILNRDPELDVPAAARPPGAPGAAEAAGVPVPRELPGDVAGFTGRADALKTLDQMLGDLAVDVPAPVVISAIAGTAGVGKTALAVHWAHQVVDRFPGGQLYLNLRGYAVAEPMRPVEALSALLRSLGTPPDQIPADEEQAAGRYRSQLADRRVLVFLDNAGSVDQVRPLLPGSPGCLVLVTSRDSLTGLVARDGARRLALDVLAPSEAHALLRRLIGPRCDAEREAAAALADQCARLPLALRIAAELAASHATIPLADLVAELGDQQRRLDLLACADDPRAAVRTVFSWSVQHLPPAAAATFRLLALHAGPDIDRYAVAALTDTSLEDARHRLELLTRAHLVQITDPGRYSMHDLLRAYAAELTHTRDTEQVRHAAVGQLLDYYRHTASVAMDAAYPYERARLPRIAPAETPTPELPDPDQATGWLDIEHSNLLAAARHAADHGWPEHILDLSAILRRHLRTRSRYGDAETLHHVALTTARTTGDHAGEHNALTGLGWVHQLQGQQERAADYYRQALGIARAIGDRVGELDALRGLGHVQLLQGRRERAADYYRQALEIARAIGDRAGEQYTLSGLARVHQLQGRHGRAVDYYRQALEIVRAIGDRVGELDALSGLARVQLLQGRHGRAADYFRQALEIAHVTGHRLGELTALSGLARIHRLQGRYEQAAGLYQEVLDLARETGDRNWQFEALHGLGRLHHTTGHPDAALAYHQQALELATDLGQPDDQARAHDGLAHAHHALNKPEEAHQRWHQALEILISLGTDHTGDPEANAATIRGHLASASAEHQSRSAVLARTDR